MQCDVCKKKLATVHLTEIHDGKKSVKHLCPSCAVAHQGSFADELSLADLFAGIASTPGGNRVKNLSCSGCGMNFEEFQKTGRLGCDRCYNDFRGQFVSLLKKIHNAKIYHRKKTASGDMTKPADSLPQFKAQLDAAVKAENFELAAQLRDHIRQVEKQKTSTAPKMKMVIPAEEK